MIRTIAIAALLLCGSAALADDPPKLQSPALDALTLPTERTIEEIAKDLGLVLIPGRDPNKAGSYRPKEIPDRKDPIGDNRG